MQKKLFMLFMIVHCAMIQAIITPDDKVHDESAKHDKYTCQQKEAYQKALDEEMRIGRALKDSTK